MEPTHNSSPDLYPSEQPLEAHSSTMVANEKAGQERLFRRGLMWLCVGVFLMALSFGINFLLFHSDHSFVTAMYLLTSLGTVCIVKSLADLLGF